MRLDDDQRAVIACEAPVVRVLAGPGTGKSTVAVELVADRVRRGLVAADRALLLTSSRLAAADLRERVTARLGTTTTQPLARTHQALGFGILRRAAVLRGDPVPVLLSGSEQDTILKELLAGHAEGAVPGPQWPEVVREALSTRGFRAELRDLLMRAVERGLEPADLARLGRVKDRPEWVGAAEVLLEYDQVTAFSRPGAYDPAWILSAAADLLLDDPDALARVREDVGLIVVDDAQELTVSAARLLQVILTGRSGRRGRALPSGAPRPQLVLLGDPDSTVQGFRGADPTLLAQGWHDLFGDGAELVLRRRHRQPPELADVTARVARAIGAVGGASHRVAPRPPAERPDGAPATSPATTATTTPFTTATTTPATASSIPPATTPTTVAAPTSAVEVALLRNVAQEAAFLAARLRRAHLVDQVPWSQMAVVVRGGGRVAALRRVLAAQGVPVAATTTEIPLRDQSAARALLLLLDAVLGLARGEDDPLDADRAADLMGSVLVGLDVVAQRRVRRAVRRARAGSVGYATERPGPARDELVTLLLADPQLDALDLDALDLDALDLDALDLDAHSIEAVARLRAALRSGVQAAARDGDGWRADTTAEQVLWACWSALQLAEPWRRSALAGGASGARADQHLDSVVALFAAAESFTERLPGAGPQAFVDQILAQDVPADSLVAAAPTDHVLTLTTPAGAAGRQWRVVAVAGLQEGVWPDLRLRGSLLGSEELVDVVAGRDGTVQAAQRAVRDDETRLLHVAVSRATERLLVTAVSSDDEQPSAYLELIDPRDDEHPRPVAHLPRPMSLGGIVAELRQQCLHVDPEVRGAAADRLALLARAGVAAADPATWWPLRALSDDRPVVPDEGPVRVSPSQLEGFAECSLRWLLLSRGGDAVAKPTAALGTLVHEIAAELGDADAATYQAELDRRFDELGLPPDTFATRHQRRRAEQMLERLATYTTTLQQAGWQLVGHELDARFDVGRAQVRARVDRLERDDEGHLRVVDLKTAGTPPADTTIASNAQLAAYQVAVEEGAFDELVGRARSGGAALLQLGTKAKSHKVQHQPPVAAADDPRWAHDLLTETAEQMGGAAFGARVGPHCRYCQVKSSCPLRATEDE